MTHVTEIVGPEARFLHQGMTSSDVNDTALAVQLARATDLLMEDVELVLAALKRRAFEYKMTPTVGRSHGIHAEPTTFGLKLAGHYAEFVRARERLAMARFEIATCAISGPVGTFASVDPAVEAHVAEKMGLRVEPISTQIIPRDRHAAYFAALAVVASSIERLAVEIRHLQRTEVLEAEEPFDIGPEGQLGHAAQAQPDPQRKPDRPRAPRPHGGDAGAGECGALARARHQPLVGGALDRARTPRSTSTSPFAGWPAWSSGWWSIRTPCDATSIL